LIPAARANAGVEKRHSKTKTEMMTRARRLPDLVADIAARLKPAATSLIITIYGDSISQHGGAAWLGSLVRLATPAGLNESAIRTAAFRLASEGWLVAEQIGRRSFYRLTESGWHRCEAVHGRIFFPPQEHWDKKWTLVSLLPNAKDTALRDALRADLHWLGFGQLTSGVLLHPTPDEGVLRQTIAESGLAANVIVMRAQIEEWIAPSAVRQTLNTCWDLKRIAAGYSDFLAMFRPIAQALQETASPDPALSFTIRTLVIHAFRRVQLRDPKLPAELLPPDWPGNAARLLCRNLYKRVEEAAEQHLASELETADGRAPEALPIYYQRFGGLRDTAAD
jgi:phenylacetic acid degradation operon negative regulatory protein